jgi:ubiquinone/menaquinone biosynthesis C-methylase UbiE
MLTRLIDTVYDMPRIKRFLNKTWYQYLAEADKDAHMLFMNYGYADPGADAKAIELSAGDENRRYCIQLYHRVAGAIDLTERHVLEIGCGRGGGSSYIMRYLRPQSMTGLDIAENAVAFCNRYHSVQGLSFRQGDAEALPFAANSFDVVVNVESSHCYGYMERFVGEVARVLRPGGCFLFTDHRTREQAAVLRKQLTQQFTLLGEERITPGVVKALDLDNERRLELIRRKAPRVLHKQFQEFAATKGTTLYEALRTGAVEYLRFVLQKKES